MRAAFLIRDGKTVEAAWLLGAEMPDIDAVIEAIRDVELRDDDELGPGAFRLTTPRVGDGIERHTLDVEPDVACDCVTHEAPVLLRELVGRDEEVRVSEDRQILEAHRRRRELGRRAGRLAEVDDRGVRHGRLNRCGSGLAPQRIEDVARAFAAERVLEGGDEVVDFVQAERRIRTVLRRSLEACSAATGRDDASRTEQLRRLHGDEADGAGGSEDEDVLTAAGAALATPDGSQPAMPAIPRPAASAGSAPSGTSITCESPIAARSAMAPCDVRPSEPPEIQTSLPSAVRPTASQPGTYGSSGWPVARMPRDTARSIGLIDAASTSIVSPVGSATSPMSATAPTSRTSAALTAASYIPIA